MDPTLHKRQTTQKVCMSNLREDRREAGFRELTIWVPVEEAEDVRTFAWELILSCGRTFPRRRTGRLS